MSSKIADWRTGLYTALQAVVVAPWRIHRVPPANPTPPCVWIGTYAQSLDGPVIRVSFPVIAVYDGVDRRQVEALDDLGAAVSDAIWQAKGRPIRSFPTTADIGGQTLRAVEYQADFSAQGVTLCTPLLEAS